MSQSRAAHHTDRARVAGVSLSHPARQVYSDLGMSKRELAEYYRDIAEHMLPSVEGRPLTIVRCPRGQGGQCFFQKHFDDTSLVGLEGVDVEESTGVGRYATAVGVAGLVQLVQLGALEIHSWLARTDRLDCPDQMIIDLDPGIGVQWSRLRDAAREVRERLERRGLQSFLRTTGGKGLHVVAPLDAVHGWEEVRGFAHALADAMQSDTPDAFVATADKHARAGKIYVDYLRNSRGATAIANYSTRAKRGAPVAVPIAWEELARITGADHYRLAGIRRRVAQLERAAWPDFAKFKQRLAASRP
jgi:bifunctional non-homologous end joining protein LigD